MPLAELKALGYKPEATLGSGECLFFHIIYFPSISLLSSFRLFFDISFHKNRNVWTYSKSQRNEDTKERGRQNSEHNEKEGV